MSASEIKGNEKKKFVFAAFLLGMAVETPLFVRDRRSYAGRYRSVNIFYKFKKQAK